MKKFRVTQDLDYVMGHLRYGHKEGIFEAESLEKIKEMFADGCTDELELVIDDYAVDDYDDGGNEIEFEEIVD